MILSRSTGKYCSWHVSTISTKEDRLAAKLKTGHKHLCRLFTTLIDTCSNFIYVYFVVNGAKPDDESFLHITG